MYLFFTSFEAAQAALQTINNNMEFTPGALNTWANVMECRAGWYFPKPEDHFMSGLPDMDEKEVIEELPDSYGL